MPRVPLDDELLAALSIGLPIGLALYLAWLNRGWSATTKATGFAAGVAGALLGAWLGFSAADGLLALVTTTAGAIAGGNLVLIALDIAWDRQAHARVAAADADVLEARPSTR
jgi:hypothetical protein